MVYFFFNDTATTEIYTLSLHDALPISCLARLLQGYSRSCQARSALPQLFQPHGDERLGMQQIDRKSTRLNSSHVRISYAVFCLKKKHPIRLSDLYMLNLSATST